MDSLQLMTIECSWNGWMENELVELREKTGN